MIILLLQHITVQAQKENYFWYFGDRMGLDFNTSPPTTLGNGNIDLAQLEGTATISTPGGELLFYSNGNKIWDRFHQQLPNGYGLLSNYTSSQASLIIPVPGNPDLFYIFCADSGEYVDPPNDGVTYSLINLCENGGAGDLLVDTKNTLLLKPATEKLAATYHTNGTDVWVMAHEGLTDAFYAWLITENGITGPVISHVGEIHKDIIDSVLGYMKFSHDGSRLAAAVYGDFRVQLYDFDNATGVVSNPVQFILPHPYGIEFSPDDKILYVTSDFKKLYQYDLSVNTEVAIKASETLIHSYPAQSGLFLHSLQLGPDGIIYASQLQRVLEPEKLGLACNFDANFGTLPIDNNGHPYFGFQAGLPNFNQSYFDPMPYIVASHSCDGEPVTFSIVNSDLVASVVWDFGDPSSGVENSSSELLPIHQYQDGTYQVSAQMQLKNGNPYQKNKRIIISDFDIDLGTDTTLCDVTSFQLDATTAGDYVCYTWQDGSTAPTYNVTTTGTYWVDVRTKGCIKRDSIYVVLEETPVVNLPESSFLCENETLQLSAGVENANYLWSNGETADEIVVSLPGTYWVEVSRDLCKVKDTVEVVGQALPVINLPTDTTFCSGSAVRLEVAQTNASYKWTTGALNSFIDVNSEGIFGVEVTINTCKNDQIVNVKEIKFINQLNIDSLICEDTVIELNAYQPGSQIAWSTGSVTPAISVNEAGIYQATISNQCYTSVIAYNIETENCDCELFIPNVFTPDGDGYNDFFRPITHQRVPMGEIVIINRWGKEVFKSSSLHTGWDGTIKGQEIDPGVYYWMIEYGCEVGELIRRKSQTGFVQLVR